MVCFSSAKGLFIHCSFSLISTLHRYHPAVLVTLFAPAVETGRRKYYLYTSLLLNHFSKTNPSAASNFTLLLVYHQIYLPLWIFSRTISSVKWFTPTPYFCPIKFHVCCSHYFPFHFGFVGYSSCFILYVLAWICTFLTHNRNFLLRATPLLCSR